MGGGAVSIGDDMTRATWRLRSAGLGFTKADNDAVIAGLRWYRRPTYNGACSAGRRNSRSFQRCWCSVRLAPTGWSRFPHDLQILMAFGRCGRKLAYPIRELSGLLERPNNLKNLQKWLVWRSAHGSICVQERAARTFNC